MVTLKGEDRPRCAHAITWGRYRRTRQKCIVAMKPNAPNPLNQFDRATVTRPLMRARLGARRGANCGPTISMITAHALLFLVASFAV